MGAPFSFPGAAMNELERWIRNILKPERMTTAELAYDHMESQSGECLAVIYQPLDHTKRSHWHDTALIGAFAHAMGEARTVLDVGPGDGWPSLRVADRFQKIVGIDPSPKRVEIQRENARRLGITNVEFLVMNAEEMSFADGAFDGVMAASAIEQCDHPERALAEVARVLRPGGRFAMIFEDFDSYFDGGDGDEELWVQRDEAVPLGEDAGGAREDSGGRQRAPGSIVMYQVRTKIPAHETRYGLFVDTRGLESIRSEAGDEGTATVAFFERLRPHVRRAGVYELDHLTSSTVGPMLAEHGFTNIRHLDHRLTPVLETFGALHEAGELDSHRETFVDECLTLGAGAVDAAGDGPGDYVVAEKRG